MDNFRKIEEYLIGVMSSEETVAFEESISSNKTLAAELSLHKEVNEALLDDEIIHFRNTLKNIIDSTTNNNRRAIYTLIRAVKIPLAASVLVVIGLSLYNIFVHQKPDQLFTNFYGPYSTDISTRSVEQSTDNIQFAYYLYQEGDYENSFEILKNYTSKNFDNQTANFYFGLSAMELNYFDLAVREFTLIEQDQLSPFALHARWYLAMAYLKTDDTINARLFLQILTESDNIYSEKAKRIIRSL